MHTLLFRPPPLARRDCFFLNKSPHSFAFSYKIHYLRGIIHIIFTRTRFLGSFELLSRSAWLIYVTIITIFSIKKLFIMNTKHLKLSVLLAVCLISSCTNEDMGIQSVNDHLVENPISFSAGGHLFNEGFKIIHIYK